MRFCYSALKHWRPVLHLYWGKSCCCFVPHLLTLPLTVALRVLFFCPPYLLCFFDNLISKTGTPNSKFRPIICWVIAPMVTMNILPQQAYYWRVYNWQFYFLPIILLYNFQRMFWLQWTAVVWTHCRPTAGTCLPCCCGCLQLCRQQFLI